MFLGGETHLARGAPALDLDVIGLVLAIGHIGGGRVGQGHQQIAQLGVFRIGLGLHRGDFGFLLGHQRADPLELGLVAGGFRSPHQFGGGVLIGLCGLCGMDQAAARLVQREHFRRHRISPAARKGGIKLGGVFADRADIVHGVTSFGVLHGV